MYYTLFLLRYKNIPLTSNVRYIAIDGPMEREVICHNDIAPYNMVFQDDIPYKMIDFDTCCSAPRIWDIVYAIYPLSLLPIKILVMHI